jgi:hypothetical protein
MNPRAYSGCARTVRSFCEVRQDPGFLFAGIGPLARSIEERLQVSGVQLDPISRSAHAHALAGSFFSLLDWWSGEGMKANPKENG